MLVKLVRVGWGAVEGDGGGVGTKQREGLDVSLGE